MVRIKEYVKTNIRLVGTVIPVVLLMIILFFVPTRNLILSLTKDKLSLASENYADDISAWADQILSELTIYKTAVEQLGLDNEDAIEIMESSYNRHEAYPYGLYFGDDKGTYFDASGWKPEKDYMITERNWYVEGLEHTEFAFGEPYIDVMTGEPCVSVSVHIENAPAVSVLATDVYLGYVSELVAEITKGNVDDAFFVTGGSRVIVADSNASMVGASLKDGDVSLLYQNVDKLLDENKTGQSKITCETGSCFVDVNAIKNTDWFFVTCLSEEEAMKDVRQVEFITLLIAVVASVVLISVTLQAAKEMSEAKVRARTDTLTGLLNRGGFGEMTNAVLKEHPDRGILFIMDLDNFKFINDELGHPEGDAVLKQFAVMLEKFFNRNSDIVARIGGDEFAVFIGREIGEAEAEVMLQKFTSIVHRNFGEKYGKQKLSVSIGGNFVKEDKKYDTLYQGADNALYEVKRSGKNGFRILQE